MKSNKLDTLVGILIARARTLPRFDLSIRMSTAFTVVQISLVDKNRAFEASTLLYVEGENASCRFSNGAIPLFTAVCGLGDAQFREDLDLCQKNDQGDLTWLGGCQALVVAIAVALTLLDDSKREFAETFRLETFRALEEAAAAE